MIGDILGKVFTAGVGVRKKLYESRILSHLQFDVPVISVGNLSVGGTGKTPLVSHLLKELVARGKNPILLSRGYGRSSSDLKIIPPKFDVPNAATIGDEPLMLKRQCPEVTLLVHSQRARMAHRNWSTLRGDIIVMDDGFQHWQAVRDLDIVAIDISRKVNSALLPTGRNREPVTALRRADAIVLTRFDEIDLELARSRAEYYLKNLSGAPKNSSWRRSKLTTPAVFLTKYRVQGFFNLSSEQIPREAMERKNLVGLAGVGNPGSVKRLLQNQGISLLDWLIFPDHKQMTSEMLSELRSLKRKYSDDNMAFVTTEKDAVRWQDVWPKDLGALFYVAVEHEFIPSFSAGSFPDEWKERLTHLNFPAAFVPWVMESV